MPVRAILLACASLAMVSAAALAQPNASTQARCEDMNFRIYFDHGSAALNPLAAQTLAAAERNVAGCRYKEMRVRLDTSTALAAARGHAILAAAHGDAWNAARAEAMPPAQRAAFSAGPEFAEVAMADHPLPAGAPAVNTEAGV
ncbi:MAG: hypothetical protein QM759_08120 [Terricaulis sp.]